MRTILRPLIHKPAQFLGKLCGYDDLVPLHDQWIRETWDTEGPRGIRAYRGSFKTSAVVVLGCIRYLLLNPDKRIVLIRKTQMGDASPTLTTISRLWQTEGIQAIYQALYPGAGVVEDTRSRFRLSTLPDGYKEASIMAFGIGDSITGTHADVILADDILNIKDRISSAERTRTKNSFFELQNIIDHLGRTKQIYCGTVWHEKDVWTEIEKIAVVKDYPASEYWFFGPEALEAKKAGMPSMLYAINYELTFVKDESLPFKDMRFVEGALTTESWRKDKVYAHVDAGYGGDTTALTLLCGDAVRGWCWEKHINDVMPEINAICSNHSVSRGFTETNADKGYSLAKLQEAKATAWTGYAEKMNKQVKISTYLREHWARLIFDASTDDLYTAQISEWIDDTTAYDDAPDSLASLLREAGGGKGISDDLRKELFGYG